MNKLSVPDLHMKLEKQQLQISLLEEELRDINNALESEQSHCASLESDIEHLILLLQKSKDDL